MAISKLDHAYMQRAFALATSVVHTTDPNPRVGCVLVNNQGIIGQGATQAVGGPHAEVMALKNAKAEGNTQYLVGSTAYVTLEPCCHVGRTPPCTDALIAHGIGRVVIAMVDPNPLVAGKGIRMLKQAGIVVDTMPFVTEWLDLNSGFVSRMAIQRPWVRSKIACSLDGRTALKNGVSQWITHAQARADGQYWRGRSSVVLTGIGTILSDNPLLTVRTMPIAKQPLRAVIDSAFCIAENAAIFNGDKVIVFTTTDNQEKARRLARQNVEVYVLPQKGGHIDIDKVFVALYAMGANEIHVEAGATLNGVLLQAGLIDELLLYVAPKVLGEGRGLFAIPALETLAQAHSFEWFDYCKVGDDARVRLMNKGSWEALCHSVSKEYI